MAVGPGGINYMPQNRAAGNLAGMFHSPFSQQIQQLAAQLGGGAGGNLAQNFNVPAPNLAPGTYDGAYAAQGLRTSNPQQAAQLWESRHPGAMHSGNIPPWVMQAQTQELQNATPQGGQMNPHQVLNDIVAHHRASNGLPAMHPEELHGRVTSLAHEILHGRNNRLQRALRGIRPPVAPPQAPPGPVGGPFQAV